MIHIKTAIRTVAALSLAAATLTAGSAAAQECRAPAFETVRPSQAAATGMPVRVSNLMRIALPGQIERLSFDPHGLAARFGDGGRLLLAFDDASVAHRNNGVTEKAGPLLQGMLNGSTIDGCVLLKTYKLDQEDYRVKFVRGTLSVYAYGTGATHHFVVIHEAKPDVVVQGLAKDFERQAFLDLISTIHPPVQE